MPAMGLKVGVAVCCGGGVVDVPPPPQPVTKIQAAKRKRRDAVLLPLPDLCPGPAELDWVDERQKLIEHTPKYSRFPVPAIALKSSIQADSRSAGGEVPRGHGIEARYNEKR